MERGADPAHLRVGINIGSAEEGALSTRLLVTTNEVMARFLNLLRLLICAAPVVIQCFYIHSVDFGTWLLKLIVMYSLIFGIGFFAMPEQLYMGMGLGTFRWVFEWFYPEAIGTWSRNGPGGDAPASGVLFGGLRGSLSELAGARCRIRWHSTGRYLCIDQDGWAVTSEENLATTLLLHHVFIKDKKVPDTYTLRIVDQALDWHNYWLSFQAINHLRFGGWLGAYRDKRVACPYKVIQDSSCPVGCCKMLCACTNMPPPSLRYCTGFYLSEQLSGNRAYVGHAPDRDAALLELVLA